MDIKCEYESGRVLTETAGCFNGTVDVTQFW